MEQMTDFQLFIKVNKLKQKQVADYLDTSPQYINQVAKGVCSLSDEKYEKLVQGDWDISMLNIPPYIKIPATVTVYNETKVNTDDGANVSVVPANVVEEAKAEAIEEYKAEESVPFLATDLVTATINVRKFVEKNADELDQIDPSKLLNNPDFAEMITGTSMLPTFAPNDKVFIKLLPDRSQLIDGKMYYFDLDNLPTMIRKVKFEDGDKLRLIAKNPAFADIIIDRTHILNIGKVVGMFRETFGDQYDEIDEIRKQKDTQIDNLIKQNTKALDSIGELISVIKNK